MSVDQDVSPVHDEELSVGQELAVTTEQSQQETADEPPAPSGNVTEEEEATMAPRPKRPLSAYNMFFRDQREILLKTLPKRRSDASLGKGHGKIGFQDLARVIGAKWREIDPQEKEQYEKVASEGRTKYLALAKAWKVQQKKHGLPVTKHKKKKASRKVSSSSSASVANQAAIVQQRENSPAIWMGPSLVSQNPRGSRGTLSLPSYRQLSRPSIPQSFNNNNNNMLGQHHTALGDLSVMGMNQNHSMASNVFSTSNAVYDTFSGMTEGTSGMDASIEQTLHGLEQESSVMLDFEPIPSNSGFASSGVGDALSDCFSVMDPGLPNAVPPSNEFALHEHSMYAFGEFGDPLPYNVASNTAPKVDYGMNQLADRMGQDCVDLFVGMFGNSRGA